MGTCDRNSDAVVTDSMDHSARDPEVNHTLICDMMKGQSRRKGGVGRS